MRPRPVLLIHIFFELAKTHLSWAPLDFKRDARSLWPLALRKMPNAKIFGYRDALFFFLTLPQGAQPRSICINTYRKVLM